MEPCFISDVLTVLWHNQDKNVKMFSGSIFEKVKD